MLVIALRKKIFDIQRCDRFIEITRKINKARYPKGLKSICDYESKVLRNVGLE